MELLLIGVMVVLLTLLLYIAHNSAEGLKFILYGVSTYLFISYILRPLIFISSRDQNISNPIYDSRLGQNPGEFISLMSLIILGYFVFCIPFLLKNHKKVDENTEQINSNNYQEFVWIISYGLLCGILALFIESTTLKNPFSKSLVPLVSICFSIFLWKRKELRLTKTINVVILTCGCISTILFSMASNNSKGILLFPCVVYISTLKIWKEVGLYFKKTLFMILLLITFIPAFSKLQNIKLGDSVVAAITSNQENFSWYLSPFIETANRFDMFARVADSYFAEPGSLGGLGSWINYFLESLKWNPGSGRTQNSFGQDWNQLITNQSLSGSRFSNVSLAQGMIAEGYIWFGVTSLILECLLFSIIFMYVAKFLEGGPLSLIFAFGIISNGAIFESGSIQFAGILSATLKVFFFIWVSKKIWSANLRYKKFRI